MKPLSDGVARSQTRAVISALETLTPVVLEQGRPADRELATWLRAHREFGGRDRRLIGDLLFDYFRWWGWLGTLTPAVEAVDDAQQQAAWAPLLLALGLINGHTPETLLRLWAALAGVDPAALPGGGADIPPAARLVGIPGLDPAALNPAALVPDWVPAQVTCPLPAEDWIGWMQRRAPLWLRVQGGDAVGVVAELQAAGLAPERHARLSQALLLGHGRVHLPGLAAYEEGRVEVQDLAAQGIVAACGARAGESWLDACAGAGGKTLGLAAAVAPGGRVLAGDVRASALQSLRDRARRAGVQGVDTRVMDGADTLPADARFDGVLVDAPCTGSGVWRRSPWARWQLSADALPRFAETQLALLNACARRVRPGGVLVYATCSLFRAENHEVVARFLAQAPEFSLAPFAHPVTGVPTNGQTLFWPWEGDHDAMFAARLRRLSR